MVGNAGVSGLLPSLSGSGGQKPPSFNQVDANNDGTISLDEFSGCEISAGPGSFCRVRNA